MTQMRALAIALLLSGCGANAPMNASQANTSDLKSPSQTGVEIHNVAKSLAIPSDENIYIQWGSDICLEVLSISPAGDGFVLPCDKPVRDIVGSKQTYLKIREIIDPIRRYGRMYPYSSGYDIPCGRWSTDGSSARVEWSEKPRSEKPLTASFYFGCDSGEMQKVASVLSHAIKTAENDSLPFKPRRLQPANDNSKG